jgi:hypothetical protein
LELVATFKRRTVPGPNGGRSDPADRRRRKRRFVEAARSPSAAQPATVGSREGRRLKKATHARDHSAFQQLRAWALHRVAETQDRSLHQLIKLLRAALELLQQLESKRDRGKMA